MEMEKAPIECEGFFIMHKLRTFCSVLLLLLFGFF